MHGMLATFAEYYSNNLATEIKKGLYRKHEVGGTPFKPPIGYRPVRKLVEGREVRSIELDPERAPLVGLAFDLYATGTWSLVRLTAYLHEAGLVSRPTPKQGARPLVVGTVHKMLKNPYYMGIVQYSGRRSIGLHERIVDPDTFDRVQLLLAAARQGRDRPVDTSTTCAGRSSVPNAADACCSAGTAARPARPTTTSHAPTAGRGVARRSGARPATTRSRPSSNASRMSTQAFGYQRTSPRQSAKRSPTASANGRRSRASTRSTMSAGSHGSRPTSPSSSSSTTAT
jgi:hypothetical protein